MMTLFGNSVSGNCYKVRLGLAATGQDFTYIDVDSLAGQTRTPAFLALNPVGKIPALRLADGTLMTESNAILWYLCRETALWPVDPIQQQSTLSWLFWEQYSHEPKVAVARSWTKLGRDVQDPAGFAQLVKESRQVLDHMELQLNASAYLVANTLTIADISLYAYTHKAGDIGLELNNWPGIHGWLQRVASEPWFVDLNTYPSPIALSDAL